MMSRSMKRIGCLTSYESPPASVMDLSKKRPHWSLDHNATTEFLIEVWILLKTLVDKLAISAGGMTETELYDASDVIREDTVIAVYRHDWYRAWSVNERIL